MFKDTISGILPYLMPLSAMMGFGIDGEGGGEGDAAVALETFNGTAIPEGLKESAIGKYATIGDLSKGYEEAQKMIGAKGIILPKEGDAADLDRYYNESGRPVKAEEYKFTPLENLHESVKMTPEDEAGFKSMLHKHGLSAKQADGLNADYFNMISSALVKKDEATATAKHEAETALRTEWGADFDKNASQAKRLVEKYGGADAIEAFGDLGNNPQVLKTLANIGKKFSEDGFVKGEKVVDLEKKDAQAQIDKIMMDKDHPYFHKVAGHEEAKAEMKRLFAITNPEIEV